MRHAAEAASHVTRLRELVYKTTGIKMPPSKWSMAESRLRRRSAALGMDSVEDYLRFVFDDGGLDREMPHIIERITTNKTDFFREPEHFRILAERVIPEFRLSGRRGLKLWSAAASVGAEAWSAAMVLAEAGREKPIDFAILGTDISPRVLKACRRAVYPAAELDPVPHALRGRYAMQGRDENGATLLRIVPELRRRARFSALNLIEIPYPIDQDLDVIFLRNVLIYFEPDLQERIVTAMCGHLRPGGYLFVGHTESAVVRAPALRQLSPAVFRKEVS